MPGSAKNGRGTPCWLPDAAAMPAAMAGRAVVERQRQARRGPRCDLDVKQDHGADRQGRQVLYTGGRAFRAADLHCGGPG